MISTVQSCQLNNTVVNIDLKEVPNFSASSKEILSALNPNLPAEFQTATPLSERIHSMEKTKELLKETQDNNNRIKIVAFIKTAFLIALVASAIILFILGGSATIGAIIVQFSISLIYPSIYFYTISEIKNISKRMSDYSTLGFLSHPMDYDQQAFIAMTGAGFILPLFEACTRESRVQKVLEKQQQSIEETLSQYKTQNEQLLGGAHQFYQDHSTELMASLDQKVEQLIASHAAMTQLAERSAAGEQELIARREAHQKARDELDAVQEFYEQFDAI